MKQSYCITDAVRVAQGQLLKPTKGTLISCVSRGRYEVKNVPLKRLREIVVPIDCEKFSLPQINRIIRGYLEARTKGILIIKIQEKLYTYFELK